tara:strand:+ start:232 stop:417 length:186 start_codon:yes stop_codon:yes gene_type:complete
MSHWIETLIEEQYFPFYEFLWLGMIALWWSVIARLKRIEQKCDELEEITTDIIGTIVEEEA